MSVVDFTGGLLLLVFAALLLIGMAIGQANPDGNIYVSPSPLTCTIGVICVVCGMRLLAHGLGLV